MSVKNSFTGSALPPDAEKKDEGAAPAKDAKVHPRAGEINNINIHGTNKLIASIEKGEVGLIMVMLDNGADVHFRTQKQDLASRAMVNVPYAVESTPLHVACMLGEEKIVTLLTEYGADVNAKNAGGQTPIDCAILSHAYYEAEVAKKSPVKDALARLPLGKKLPLARFFGGKTAEKLQAFESIIRHLLERGAKPALFTLPEKFSGKGPKSEGETPDMPEPPAPPLP